MLIGKDKIDCKIKVAIKKMIAIKHDILKAKDNGDSFFI